MAENDERLKRFAWTVFGISLFFSYILLPLFAAFMGMPADGLYTLERYIDKLIFFGIQGTLIGGTIFMMPSVFSLKWALRRIQNGTSMKVIKEGYFTTLLATFTVIVHTILYGFATMDAL